MNGKIHFMDNEFEETIKIESPYGMFWYRSRSLVNTMILRHKLQKTIGNRAMVLQRFSFFPQSPFELILEVLVYWLVGCV